MLGSPILYLKGRRRMMFQLSGFYCIGFRAYRAPQVGCLGFRGLGFRGVAGAILKKSPYIRANPPSGLALWELLGGFTRFLLMSKKVD